MEFFATLPQDGRRQTIHLAASFCSLDCEVRTDLIHDYRTRASNRTFSIGASARVMVPKTAPGGEVHQVHVLNLWRTGECPLDHPLLDCLRGCMNYEFIQAAIAGQCGSLCLGQDGHHRTRYILGSELPSLLLKPRARTTDLHKAAALGILGVPIIKIEGGVITLGMGTPLPQYLNPSKPQPPVDPAEILQQFNAKTIATDHPFVTAWNACRYLDAMDLHLENEEGKVLYSQKAKPGETRPQKGYVTPNAPGAVMDRVRHFIKTGK